MGYYFRPPEGRNRQSGFITMIVVLIIILVTVIVFSYKRVLQVQH